MLPLCVGMPVRATEHLDRRRCILKGCRGTVVGWSACAGEPENNVVLWNKLPEVVYVRFDTTERWQIEGVPDSNVYPVATCKRVWFLDRQRRSPQLRVWRTQFPLAPAFAITAHVAQGQTIPEGVLTDLCVGFGGNPFTAYVAFTRVRGRDHLFIYRAFDAAPFQQGIGLGRDLLLRQLRGDRIDWQALLAKYCEARACSVCSERKQSNAFTAGQWKRSETDRVCRECVKSYADAGAPWQCNVCKLWHAEANFPRKHRQRQCSFYRVCLTCEVSKTCAKCGHSKAEAEFGAAAWKARHTDRRICRGCATKARGQWTCSVCREQCPRSDFSAWEATRSGGRNDGTQRCNQCVQLALVCAIARRANARIERQRQRATRQRQEAILAEVRALIAEKRVRAVAAVASGSLVPAEADMQDTGATACNLAADSARTPQSGAAPTEPATSQQRRYTYTCPFCAGTINSRIETGCMDHRAICGNQFRVRNGSVVARSHEHSCPKCGTKVWSTKATGRIQSLHQTAEGKPCKQQEWVAK